MLPRATITLAVSLATLAWCGATALAATADRTVISAGEVVEAVRSRGVSVEPQQVSFLASATATVAAPKLHVTGAKAASQSETAVRLACESNTICLPFYVILRGVGSEQRLLLSQAGAGPRAVRHQEKPCIRNGDRASLVMESQDMQITLPVIALQNGRRGETIRATDTERKRVYRAEVFGPGLLKSAL